MSKTRSAERMVVCRCRISFICSDTLRVYAVCFSHCLMPSADAWTITPTRLFAHRPPLGKPMSTLANVTRRRFLQAAGLSGLGLGTPGLVAARVGANQTRLDGAAEKSCIFILLCGGPSHTA